jgi:hypothetical protein
MYILLAARHKCYAGGVAPSGRKFMSLSMEMHQLIRNLFRKTSSRMGKIVTLKSIVFSTLLPIPALLGT